jgi:hypothetical protein
MTARVEDRMSGIKLRGRFVVPSRRGFTIGCGAAAASAVFGANWERARPRLSPIPYRSLD